MTIFVVAVAPTDHLFDPITGTLCYALVLRMRSNDLEQELTNAQTSLEAGYVDDVMIDVDDDHLCVLL